MTDHTQYEMDYDADGNRQALLPYRDPLPPIVDDRQFRKARGSVLGGMVSASIMFLLLVLAVILLEVFAGPQLRPSSFLAMFHGRQIAENKAYELETQAQYDAWAREVEARTNQIIEQYRAKTQAMQMNYQAVYERARVYSAATAEMQKDYVHQTMTQTRAQTTGSEQLANWANFFADIFRPVDPQLSENLETYSQGVSDRLRAKLDESVSKGVTIDVEGWDTGLPTPDQINQTYSDIKPLEMPPLPRMSRDKRGVYVGEY